MELQDQFTHNMICMMEYFEKIIFFKFGQSRCFKRILHHIQFDIKSSLVSEQNVSQAHFLERIVEHLLQKKIWGFFLQFSFHMHAHMDVYITPYLRLSIRTYIHAHTLAGNKIRLH